MKKLNYDGLTGKETVTDLTAEQLAQYKIDQADDQAQQAEAEAKTAQRQLILDKLGLTSDEAKLLIG